MDRLVGFLSAIGAAAVVGATEPESPAQEADGYAKTAHIRLLQDGDPDELRLWVSGTIVVGDTKTGIASNGNGTLVRPTGITQCRMVVTNPATGAQPTGAPPCEAIKNPARAHRILGLLPELSQGGLKSCEVLDGDEWVIDGVYQGHRFTFRIDNPEFCNDVIKEMTAFTDNNEWRAP